jgi:phosphatidylglycerol:prolipoprotein diacylglycerol transferase
LLPILNWGSWHISTYALCYALMYAVLGIYIFVRLRQLEIAPKVRARSTLLFLFSVFAGSLVNVIAASLLYWARTGEFARMGHISAVWGSITGLAVAFWLFKRFHIPLGKGFDLGILPIPLGQAIGRLGCLAAGCCGGSLAPKGWGLYMPDGFGFWLNRYPTQPISMLFDLFIFMVLLMLDSQPVGSRFRPFNGFLLVMYLLLFSAKRFTVEFFRADYQPVLGPFSTVNLVTLAMFAFAVGIWVRSRSGGLLSASEKVA